MAACSPRGKGARGAAAPGSMRRHNSKTTKEVRAGVLGSPSNDLEGAAPSVASALGRCPRTETATQRQQVGGSGNTATRRAGSKPRVNPFCPEKLRLVNV